MVTIKTNVGKEVVSLNLPTTLKEIDYDYLNDVTGQVQLGQHWALVAVIGRTELGLLLDTKRKDSSFMATYKLVKKNDPNNVCNAKENSILICDGTSVMRGNEVAAPKNVLSPSNIVSHIKAHNDVVGNKKITIGTPEYHATVYFVTFKMIPLNEIHGWYDESVKVDSNNKYQTRETIGANGSDFDLDISPTGGTK